MLITISVIVIKCRLFGLHFEASIREGLLEGNTSNETRVLQSSTLHLLDTDHIEGQELVEHHDRIDDHVGEELFRVRHELRAQRRRRAFDEQRTLLALVMVADLHRDLLDLVDRHSGAQSKRFHDHLRVNSLFNELLAISQDLRG